MPHLKKRFLASVAVAFGVFVCLPFVTLAATLTGAASPNIACTGDTLPAGWIITGHFSDSTHCGGNAITRGVFFANMETIAPPSTIPTTMCADSPQPEGFVMTGSTTDPTCALNAWDRLTGAGKRITLVRKSPSQLAGLDPTATGCTAQATVIAKADIFDTSEHIVGTLLLLHPENCAMYYSEVTSNNHEQMISADIRNGGIMDKPNSYRSPTISASVVRSPLLPVAIGITCADGFIGQSTAVICAPPPDSGGGAQQTYLSGRFTP